jgi:hypothetical protein
MITALGLHDDAVGVEEIVASMRERQPVILEAMRDQFVPPLEPTRNDQTMTNDDDDLETLENEKWVCAGHDRWARGESHVLSDTGT